MKQLERDAQFSYDVKFLILLSYKFIFFFKELHLFRETVYKKFLYEIEKSNGCLDKSDIFEIIETTGFIYSFIYIYLYIFLYCLSLVYLRK